MTPSSITPILFSMDGTPGADCYSYAAVVLWFLGYPDQALKRKNEALTLARELSHSFSLTFALGFAGFLHAFRREGQATQEHAEATMALSTEQGFAHWLAHGMIFRGWALAEQGDEGIAQICQGIAAWRDAGDELNRATRHWYTGSTRNRVVTVCLGPQVYESRVE